MNIYLISQTINCNYDTYDSAVVYAFDEEEAKHIHPNGSLVWYRDLDTFVDPEYKSWALKNPNHQFEHFMQRIEPTWASPKEVKVELKGKASGIKQSGVICSSFKAG